MVLIWTNLRESPEKKLKPYFQKRKYLAYPNALREVHAALKEKYEITSIRDEEIVHQIVLLKYTSETKTWFVLFIAGTREEINRLQEDETVKRSLFR